MKALWHMAAIVLCGALASCDLLGPNRVMAEITSAIVPATAPVGVAVYAQLTYREQCFKVRDEVTLRRQPKTLYVAVWLRHRTDHANCAYTDRPTLYNFRIVPSSVADSLIVIFLEPVGSDTVRVLRWR